MRRPDLSGRYSSPRVRPVKRATPAHKAARFVDKVPADAPLWLRLHAVADKNIAGFVAALSAYREELLRSLPLGDLVNALSTSDPLTTTDALLARLDKVTIPVGKILDDPLEGISAQYRDVILGGAKEALDLELPTLQRLPYTSFKLDLTNRYAVRYAQEMGSTLIRQVSQETIEAVRAIVASALRAPTALAPVQQAKLIRQVVGLTSRQAAQVARYRFAQKGKDSVIEKRVERFANRLHRQRAMNIARTETIRASNAGVRVIADELKDNPLYRTTDLKFIWIVTPDDRLCSRCAPMDKQVVGYSENFQEGDESPQAPAKRFSGKWPPLHPQCRCAIARKVESIEELEERLVALTPPTPAQAGLNQDQYAALAPAKRFNRNLRKETEDVLRATPEGDLLANTINDFQHSEAVKGLRAGITKELAEPGTGGERARNLLAAMRGAPETEDVLWRGMRVGSSQKALLEQYAEGKTFDMNLSSFSTSPGVAQVFAEGAGKASGTRVIMGVVGKKRGALPIQNLAKNSSVFSEKELIMGGRFQVIGAEKQGNTIVISLRQLEGL